MDKYGEMGDSLYCYPHSNTLKNKLHIQDEKILEQAELELTEYASLLIEYAEPPYDLQYLKNIMPHYFQTFMNGLVSFDRLTSPKVTHAFVPLAVLKLRPISFLNNFNLKAIFNTLNSNSLLLSLLTSIAN